MKQVKDKARRMALMVSAISTAALVALPHSAYGQEVVSSDAITPDQADVDGELAQIVVTARRRAENLQTTPTSVTALSGADADRLNIRNFQDLRGLVPNLEVQPLLSGGTSITIRGIGQNSAQANVDAKAGFYVDEMYVARQEGNALYFYDVENLQVLNGPQGTLFGKNTTAGALLLTTVRPGAELGGFVRARGGNFNRFDTEGGLNIPLSDKVQTRLSWRTQSADGFLKHALDDGASNRINDKSVRFQVRLLPTSNLTIDFLTEYNESKADGLSTVYIGCNPTTSHQLNYAALHSATYCATYPVLADRYAVYGGAKLSIPTSSLVTDIARGGDAGLGNQNSGGNLGPFNNTRVTTQNLRIGYDLTDNLTLKSITGYRHSSSQFYNPTVNAPDDIYAELDDTHTSQFTQEVNLTGKALNSRLNYVLGLYYFRQKTFFDQNTGPDWIDPVGYHYRAWNDYTSYALYAQASLQVVKDLELTVGGRYSWDRKDARSTVFLQTNTAAPCNGFANAFRAGAALCGGTLTGANTASWSSFDPRVQLSYRWTPDIMTYASYTKGYNAGGFNQQIGSNVAQGSLISYDPEKVHSFEAGFKSEWLNRRLRFNLALFYQKYDDIQTTLQLFINGISTRQVQTGATAHQKGIEADVEWLITRDFILRANTAVLRQGYDSIRPGVTAFNLSTPVSAAPGFTYAVAGQYTFHLGNADVVANLDWKAVDRRPACNPLGGCSMPGYGVLGGRLEYRPAADWSVGLWGTNLSNTYAQIAKNVNIANGSSALTVGRPREFGIDVRKSF